MKPKNSNNAAPSSTWLSYIKDISSVARDFSGSLPDNVDFLNVLNGAFSPLFYHSVPMVYLLDYTTGKYLTMSKSAHSVLGYDPTKFLGGGINFTIDKYEPRHLAKFNTEIFPDRLVFLKGISPSDHCNYIFTYNLSLQSSENKYLELLQRNIFIKSDDQGQPLLSLGIVMNMNHFTNGKTIKQVIERVPTGNQLISAEVIFAKNYFLNGVDGTFSRREKEILGWLSQGMTSKQVADKLFISEGTVIVHRKNMLEKSQCPNVGALIAFAMQNGII